MGRKLNISQPAVIQTELRPLDESFWIDANGRFEQWYYQNTNVFAPDRQITPLILTPYLSAVDRDTNTTYTPSFQLDHWEVKEYIDGAWVTTTITSQSQTSDYVLQGLSLIVKKNNYDATHAINITCKATYQDPRDEGSLHYVTDSVMLVTSIDATQAFPKIDIVNPATRTYNPLKDKSPVFEFKGKADWDGVEAQGGTAITECKVDPLGTEQILPTNDEMMLNAAPTLNIHYGDIEKANQKFMYRQTANGEVSEIIGGVSAIDNIKGNTVAWNQKLTVFSTDDWEGDTGTVITFNNGIVHVEQNSTAEDWGVFAKPNKFYFIQGHKYYCSFSAKSDNPVSLRFSPLPSDSPSDFDVSAIWGKFSCIKTCTDTGFFYTRIGRNDAVFDAKNIMIIDLTLMFGEGNEPSTVEEFETWLANNVGLKDYYEYCSGKLVNFGGFGVKWNQLVSNTFVFGQITSQPVPQSVVIVSGHKYYLAESNYENTDYTCSFYGQDYNAVENSRLFTFDQSLHKGIITSSINAGGIEEHTDRAGCLWFYNSHVTTQNHKFNLIDLTEMFGAGNEPDLEWCDKYFSKDYYPYCPSVEKNILDVMTTKEVVDGVAQYKSPEIGIKTTGFNLWDEEFVNGYWSDETGVQPTLNVSPNHISSKNIISVQPNTIYYLKLPDATSRVCEVDNDGIVIKVSYTATNSTYETGDGCVGLLFTSWVPTYNNDICINISDPAKNGTYEPYWESKSDMSWITKIGIENFNIWDEEWELGWINGDDGVKYDTNNQYRSKNYIPVTPNTTYNIRHTRSAVDVFLYDSEFRYISHTVVGATEQNRQFTTPSNCHYLLFSNWGDSVAPNPTYLNDICINISNAHFNGRYYPHGETAPYFPNGLCKAGSVFDEVKVENGKIKGVVRIGSVDLGTLDWEKGSFAFYVTEFNAATPSSSSTVANILTGRYQTIADTYASASNDKTTYLSPRAQLGIVDSTYFSGTVSAFKTAMSGVMLYYELETPYEFEIDYPTKGQFMWYGVDGSNNEVPIDQLPIYSQATQPSGYGQGTSRININALYGENIPVMLRVKRYPWSPNVLPPKVTKSVAWSIPPVDVITTSDKGSAVRATNSSEDFIFGTIVNQQGEIISEEKKAENMVFDWYMVKYGTSGAIKTSLGSGLTKTIPAATLKNTTPSGGVTPSTNVYCEAFLLGAYHLVDGQYVRTKD